MTTINGMPVHELKVWPQFWPGIESGAKPFEVRRNDRGFLPGDWLRLREWWDGEYLGRTVLRQITYVLKGEDCPAEAVAGGFVVLGLDVGQRVTS